LSPRKSGYGNHDVKYATRGTSQGHKEHWLPAVEGLITVQGAGTSTSLIVATTTVAKRVLLGTNLCCLLTRVHLSRKQISCFSRHSTPKAGEEWNRALRPLPFSNEGCNYLGPDTTGLLSLNGKLHTLYLKEQSLYEALYNSSNIDPCKLMLTRMNSQPSRTRTCSCKNIVGGRDSERRCQNH